MRKDKAKRPRLCPELECTPLRNMIDEDYLLRGGSGDCVGILKEPVVFTYKGTVHDNNMSHCIFTPLKGMIRFQVNSQDAWRIFLLMAVLMDKENPMYCEKCGFLSRVWGEVTEHLDGQKLCNMCALRLGKIKWHGRERRYW